MDTAPTISTADPLPADRRRAWHRVLRDKVRTAGRDPLAGRARRVTLLLIFAWLVNLFDLACTGIAYGLGGFVEMNPLVSPSLHQWGQVVMYKISATLAATLILLAFRRHRVTEVACWCLAALYTGLALLWHAYYTLIG